MRMPGYKDAWGADETGRNVERRTPCKLTSITLGAIVDEKGALQEDGRATAFSFSVISSNEASGQSGFGKLSDADPPAPTGTTSSGQ